MSGECEIIENGARKDDCGIRPCLCHHEKPEGLVEDIMTALSPVIAGNTINSKQEESLSREIERTIREELSKRVGVDELLAGLRFFGWTVASHNDYRLAGEPYTFWLMTHPSGIYFKGEGRTDAEALAEIEKQARKVFAPSP